MNKDQIKKMQAVLKLQNELTEDERAELARWEKATADVDEVWLKDATAKGYDGKKLIEEAKALLKKYAPAK